MNNYALDFSGYCWQGLESSVGEDSGIYCAYSCRNINGQMLVDRLLYIGQSDNLRRRLSQHTASGKFQPEIDQGKSVFYSYAVLDGRSLDACEAAMIHHFRPPYNEQSTATFQGHDATTVTSSGRWAFSVAGTFTESPSQS